MYSHKYNRPQDLFSVQWAILWSYRVSRSREFFCTSMKCFPLFQNDVQSIAIFKRMSMFFSIYLSFRQFILKCIDYHCLIFRWLLTSIFSMFKTLITVKFGNIIYFFLVNMKDNLDSIIQTRWICVKILSFDYYVLGSSVNSFMIFVNSKEGFRCKFHTFSSVLIYIERFYVYICWSYNRPCFAVLLDIFENVSILISEDVF